jgi:CRISPR-associated endonuclease/helicase Cas3
VDEDRAWPEVLDLPTGAGKTTCLDIAVFALALDAERPDPWCARRIAMVVDRRVVVDQVAERGRALAVALTTSDAPVVKEVASRLTSLSQAEAPLAVYTLRGGMPKDDGWARTPDQPLIIASTVDQFGSRLLMQGYGVSSGMAPVHAGLLGNDTLLLLDEVHLSGPFAETLEALRALRQRFTGTRFQSAFLSATPDSSQGAKRFHLTAEDTSDQTVLGKRLRAHKRATLEEVTERAALEVRAIEAARDLITKHQTIAVVLNRVASALRVAKQLKESFSPSGNVEVELMTGRMRPLDRDDLLARVGNRIAAGRTRTPSDRPLIVVATQCIEAGADFDFDALITEAASLASLRQRFGRVDRLGAYGKAEGLIIRDKSEKNDPIYGTAISETFSWLKARTDKKSRTFDFSSFGFPEMKPEERAAMRGPEKHAPVLLPAYLDLWSQTRPAPVLVPEVALFLHGPESGPADIQVVWRADLEAGRTDEELTEIVAAIRPSTLEAMSVPFAAAKRWLASTRPTDDVSVSDVEGAGEADSTDTSAEVFVWDGEASRRVRVDRLRPGDTVIVPTTKGGMWSHCFDPTVVARPGDPTTAVSDLAERAALMSRGRAMLRLQPDVLKQLGLPLTLAEDLESIGEVLDDLQPDSAWMHVWLTRLKAHRRSFVAVGGEPGWSCLDGGRVTRGALADLKVDAEADITSDEDESSYLGKAVSLRTHSEDVRRFAERFAQTLRLPQALADDLALAGWLHDIGKADRRFQLLLRRGDAIDLYKDETPLAKSGLSRGARHEHQLAQRKSGYPKGTRHEVQSVAMLESQMNELTRRAHDVELVLHLVGSHHGHCRPFAPAVSDDKPVTVSLEHGDWNFDNVSSANRLHRLESSIADRFWRLTERYGWLELCWLESILRLADHRASEAEEEGAPT